MGIERTEVENITLFKENYKSFLRARIDDFKLFSSFFFCRDLASGSLKIDRTKSWWNVKGMPKSYLLSVVIVSKLFLLIFGFVMLLKFPAVLTSIM